MTKTANYQLNQWEPADKLSREDFNRDNAAIDAALKAGAAELAAVNQTVNALSETVNAHKIAVGSYTGNNGTQTISVGFTPKAVFIHNSKGSPSDAYRSGLAITGNSFNGNAVVLDLVKITTNGFQVTHNENWSVNYNIHTYYYLAIA